MCKLKLLIYKTTAGQRFTNLQIR